MGSVWIKYNGVAKNLPRNLGWNYYHAMAFGGLFFEKTDVNGNQIQSETDSFKALLPNQSDRDRIRNILINEQDRNSSVQGNKCD